AVARGDAVGDPTGHFGDGHFMTGPRRGARDGKPDDAGANHQNLHRRSSLESISAGVVDSGPSLRWGPGMTIYLFYVSVPIPDLPGNRDGNTLNPISFFRYLLTTTDNGPT